MNISYILGSTIVVLLIFTAVRSFQWKRKKEQLHQKLEVTKYLIHQVLPVDDIERNLEKILKLLELWVQAPSYAFYALDSKQQNYVVKAVRQKTDDSASIAPSYSGGLLPYTKEVYYPPVSLPIHVSTLEVSIYKEGEVPILVIPIGGKKGFIWIGPVPTISPQLKKNLIELSELLEPVIHTLFGTEHLKSRIDVVEATEKALHIVNGVSYNVIDLVRMTLQTAIRFYGISKGFLMTQHGTHFRLPVSMEMSEESISQFKNDQLLGENLISWVEEKKLVILTPNHIDYARLPSYLVEEERTIWAFLKIDRDGWNGVIGVSFLGNLYRNSSLDSLLTMFDNLLDNQKKVLQSSLYRVEILKSLAQMFDQINPYTVGYSELVSQYAVILAQEKGLDEGEIKQIALAAYLSNIGIVDISEEIFLKEGKYTDKEFEIMKLHAEVGASIAETVLGDSQIGAMIRHHHERVDGFGYPAGLHGGDIPIGARIIAVVQTFLAKINSRPYRPAMPFDQAMEVLEASAGTQLDDELVHLFSEWFRRKREKAQYSGRSLGNCWEMCCAPESVCSKCPAFRQLEKNCWDFSSNQCHEHGRECSSCYVFTEALTRDTISRQKVLEK